MILVTGGTGLVGSHLLWRLTLSGKKVRAIYRSKKSRRQVQKLFNYKAKTTDFNGSGADLYQNIDWFPADVTKIPSLDEAFTGITQVYHCAALVSFDSSRLREIQKVNMEGTANMVNLSLKYKIEKFCHVSSVAALGDAENNKAVTEENYWTPNKTNSVYSITKFASEAEVWRSTQEGLDAVIVNPAIILGEANYTQGSGSFFDYVNNKNSYTVPGSNDFVDVHDVVNIMIRLMQSPVCNQRFILSADHLSFKELFEKMGNALQKKPPSREVKRWQMQIAYTIDYLLHKLLGKKRTLYKSTLKSAFEDQKYDGSKIENYLDYNYIPLEETIKRIAAHYKA